MAKEHVNVRCVHGGGCDLLGLGRLLFAFASRRRRFFARGRWLGLLLGAKLVLEKVEVQGHVSALRIRTHDGVGGVLKVLLASVGHGHGSHAAAEQGVGGTVEPLREIHPAALVDHVCKRDAIALRIGDHGAGGDLIGIGVLVVDGNADHLGDSLGNLQRGDAVVFVLERVVAPDDVGDLFAVGPAGFQGGIDGVGRIHVLEVLVIGDHGSKAELAIVSLQGSFGLHADIVVGKHDAIDNLVDRDPSVGILKQMLKNLVHRSFFRMRWKPTIPGFRARGFANSNATAPMGENVAQHPRVRKLQCGTVCPETF